MKPIQYVGKKAQRSDSVADTGLVWAPGQVHIVTDSVAERLLAHPDVWAVATIEEAIERAGKTKPDVTDAKPKKKANPEDDQPVVSVNTRDMSLKELRDYARSHLNLTLGKVTEETARRKVNAEIKIRALRSRGA